MFRRLVVHEVAINRFLKFRMLNNGIWTNAPVVLIDPCFVLRIVRIISSSSSSFVRKFIRYRPLCYADSFGDFVLRVSFSNKDVDLVSVAFLESLFFCFFMSLF